ncbi:MAG: hypothetical protein K8F91_16970, partial [Candidatus Obscuribacterales bacterium]|nr:hypothetical protein [Candidatus Obscuribacterales bacterium]
LLEGSPSTELYYKMGLTNFCAGKYKRATVSFNAWFERNGFNDEASPLALILTYTSYRRLADNKSALNLLNRASKDKSRLSPIAIASLQAFQQGTCCNKVFSSVRKNKPADMALAHLTAAMFNSLAAKQEPYEKNLKWIIKNSSRQQDEYTIASAELNSKKSLQ